MTRHKKRRVSTRSMYHWHRYVGISAALFVIMLVITGILLNHTSEFALDKRYVQNQWLLDWYGIAAPEQISSYRTGEHWFSQWQDLLMMDEQELGREDSRLLGVVHYRDMLVVAVQGKVLLFTKQGELIEKLSGSQGVPAGMRAIGLSPDKRVVVNAAHGTYIADQELLQWHDRKVQGVKWSAPDKLPAPVYQTMLELYRGKGLNLERVVLDLHSGRLFGRWGVYVVDAAALLLLFLACSGIWLWSMRWLRERERYNKPGASGETN